MGGTRKSVIKNKQVENACCTQSLKSAKPASCSGFCANCSCFSLRSSPKCFSVAVSCDFMSYLRFLGLFDCWCSLQQTENSFFSRKTFWKLPWVDLARQNSIQLLKRLVLCKRLVKIVFVDCERKKILKFFHLRKWESKLFEKVSLTAS